MRSATIPWTLIAAWLACATVAMAQDPAPAPRPEAAPYVLELRWEAPPECPDRAAIEADLARIVVGLPGRAPPMLTADGRITRERGGYRLVLRTVRDGIAGERSLSTSRCEELGSATGLLLALSLGDGVELREPGASADLEPAAPPPPTPARDVEPAPERSPLVTLGVEVGAGWGVLPGAAPRVALTASVGSAELRGRLRVGSDLFADVAVTSDVRAVLSSGDVGLGGCWLPSLGPLRGDLCAQATWVATRARSQGASQDGAAIASHLQLGLTVGAALPLSDRLAVRVLGEGAVAVARPRFTIDGLGDVHQVDRFRFSAVVGLEARLR